MSIVTAMTKTEQKKIREQLLKQRDELVNEMQTQQAADLDQETASGDEADRASSEVERDLSHRLREDEANLLLKIESALTRLDEGTYDKCEGCGGKIPVERLLAKPSASLCIECQEKKENGDHP